MKKILVLLIALSLAFVSCNKTQSGGSESLGDTSLDGVASSSSAASSSSKESDDSVEPTSYTITWKNYDGTVLERDTGVAEGATPTYDGEEPTKAANGEFTYLFSGWTPAVAAASEDSTYTAVFQSVYVGESVVGAQPILTETGSILYGLYPQTRVGEESVIATLNALSPSEINGWYVYDGEYYAKATASVYNGESYAFDDGAAIVDGTDYWFKCEPIEWQILREDGEEYYLLSSLLLDSQAYYSSYESRRIDGQTVYANNYAESELRAWLNDEFFNVAFALNGTFAIEKSIDNGGATSELSGNPYVSANTSDKVFLPSYQDYLNADYGFTSDEGKTATREAKTTDYARATGAWCHTRNNSNTATRANGSYWTRSPSGEYDYCASVVNSGGVMSTYAVDVESHCVRPAVYIRRI